MGKLTLLFWTLSFAGFASASMHKNTRLVTHKEAQKKYLVAVSESKPDILLISAPKKKRITRSEFKLFMELTPKGSNVELTVKRKGKRHAH